MDWAPAGVGISLFGQQQQQRGPDGVRAQRAAERGDVSMVKLVGDGCDINSATASTG